MKMELTWYFKRLERKITFFEPRDWERLKESRENIEQITYKGSEKWLFWSSQNNPGNLRPASRQPLVTPAAGRAHFARSLPPGVRPADRTRWNDRAGLCRWTIQDTAASVCLSLGSIALGEVSCPVVRTLRVPLESSPGEEREAPNS